MVENETAVKENTLNISAWGNESSKHDAYLSAFC